MSDTTNNSETVVCPFIEQDCTWTHGGRDYSAAGAFISETHLVAYPGKDGILRDWHGRAIGTWSVISSRRAVFFGYPSWRGDRFYYMRARVNGRRYSLRGFGEGMIARGKAMK